MRDKTREMFGLEDDYKNEYFPYGNCDPLTDDELTSFAEELFLKLDEVETKEANMQFDIENRIERIAIALPTLVARLKQTDFEFYHPDHVLPGVEATTEESIRRIEREIGRVPLALATFWRRIGSVNLTGVSKTWFGCEYPDSLVVEPASLAVAELDDFLTDKEERLAFNFPYLIPIAPDDYCKEDVSGGMWYNVACPADSDNPIVNEERHHLPFLEYLEMALSWGGFPGLEQASFHNWPLEVLTENLLKNR